MTLLVPVTMFGWVPLTILFFILMPPRIAVLLSVIGGVLFLPMASYDFSGIPDFNKTTAIALGLLLGSLLAGQRGNFPVQWNKYDLPMFLFCFFCPIATSLSNGLGLYDGLSSSLQFYFTWGIFYWIGRRYFKDPDAIKDLCMGIIIGGLIYVPLCIYELRMSPQLSNIIYGFFPHKFLQHVRYGGYRPIVFMQHGLMVSLWMALSFTVSFWLWREKKILHIQGIPMGILVLALLIIALLCKSANGWFFIFTGVICYLYYYIFHSTSLFRLIILTIPIYIITRISNIIPLEKIQNLANMLFDRDRVASLTDRLIQEDMFSAKALEHLYFGWGGWGRGWPIDPNTGEKVVRAVDSLWVIIISQLGIIGLSLLFSAMLIGPWIALQAYNDRHDNNGDISYIYNITLGIIVIFFMIDSLFNGMINSVYILCAGALINSNVKVDKITN